MQPNEQDDDHVPWHIFHMPLPTHYPGYPRRPIEHEEHFDRGEDAQIPEWLHSQESVYSRHKPFDFKRNVLRNSGYIKPTLSQTYRRWRNLPSHMRREEPMHHQMEESRFPIYGRGWTEEGLMPNYGPLPIDQMYPDPVDYGPEFQKQFSRNSRYSNIFFENGYELGQNVTAGDQAFDNQIWLVTKLQYDAGGNLVDVPQGQNIFIAKVVTSRFSYRDRQGQNLTSKMMNRVQREAIVLRKLNHQNIIQAFDTFTVSDQLTQFPNFYILIMERMSGSLHRMSEEFTDEDTQEFIFPDNVVRDLIIQMGRAVDYIHNRNVRYAFAHQAIRPANILYNENPANPTEQFKLADFEECITYERSAPQTPVQDLLPNPESPLYILTCSSPEYEQAQNSLELKQALRTMPNDIYMLGGTCCSLISGNTLLGGNDKTNPTIHWLQSGDFQDEPEPNRSLLDVLRMMTALHPQDRITANQLVNHQLFGYLEHIEFE